MATPTLDKEDAKPEAGFADSPYITVTFRIRRFNPEVSADAVWEDFQLEIDPKERVLDALHKIKWDLDGSLTFRRSSVPEGWTGSASPVDSSRGVSAGWAGSRACSGLPSGPCSRYAMVWRMKLTSSRWG